MRIISGEWGGRGEGVASEIAVLFVGVVDRHPEGMKAGAAHTPDAKVWGNGRVGEAARVAC